MVVVVVPVFVILPMFVMFVTMFFLVRVTRVEALGGLSRQLLSGNGAWGSVGEAKASGPFHFLAALEGAALDAAMLAAQPAGDGRLGAPLGSTLQTA